MLGIKPRPRTWITCAPTLFLCMLGAGKLRATGIKPCALPLNHFPPEKHLLLLVFDHILQCLGLISASALGNYSWQTWGPCGMPRIKPVWLNARQMPSPLLSTPRDLLLNIKVPSPGIPLVKENSPHHLSFLGCRNSIQPPVSTVYGWLHGLAWSDHLGCVSTCEMESQGTSR